MSDSMPSQNMAETSGHQTKQKKLRGSDWLTRDERGRKISKMVEKVVKRVKRLEEWQQMG